MPDIVKQLMHAGIVPVVKLDDANDAVGLMDALLQGGISIVEITFRTDAAEQSIKNIATQRPNAIVGAGTVLNIETVKKAVAAGSKFIVSPGFNPTVVKYCVDNNIPIIPGVSSPTDIELALSFGLEVLKFFPAEASGGLKALKAISAPYSMIKFMPTGGINTSNLASYLAFDKIIACGGTWMVEPSLIKSHNYSEITRLSKEAIKIMHGFEFLHMAINPVDQTDKEMADAFTDIFSFGQRETNKSIFSTDYIELMTDVGPGEFGHIGIKTINVERAIAYFESKHIELDYDTLVYKGNKPTFIYLKNSIGRFKIHIIEL